MGVGLGLQEGPAPAHPFLPQVNPDWEQPFTMDASLTAEMHNTENGILFPRCQVDGSLFSGYPEGRARGA